MKKLIILFIIGFYSIIYAKINVVVSILPQTSLVKAIGKDKVNIVCMVTPGSSPHTYEPKPSQMIAISKANIYFSIGVEFEKSWLDKFKNQNHSMEVIDISKGIYKIGHNPHIWTTPQNLKILAKNIYNSLVKIDSKNKNYYFKNYQELLKKIEQTNKTIKEILLNVPKNSRFLVFHPAWGYFAKQYNLIEIPIQIDGKSPKPKEIIQIIKKAKKEDIKAIFTAPEFSVKVAKQIANELNIKVVKISPLNPNIEQNIINLAKVIANK